jgi:AraC family transcriptional regulator of adaptative response / DNA-3-methyladenine glycosylase II
VDAVSLPPSTIRPDDPGFGERYRAMSSRDSRFDGQFITGVHSTGIYCRPSCPAMTPKAANVSFYRTAAAAHEAGLRACKRCLPDAVPGSPEWNLGDDTAARAMRLIADGTVEREGVSGLASRLGYTPRHLGRVLVEQLGAGPLALSRAHRAQNARALLVGTTLPIADVAFAAGFSSVRQFNETIQTIYERTPSALRSSNSLKSNTKIVDASAQAPTGPTTVTLRLPVRAPFDGVALMRFFAVHAVAGIEQGDDTFFRRLVRLPHGIAKLELRLDAAHQPSTAHSLDAAHQPSTAHSLGTAHSLSTASDVVCIAELTALSDLPTLVARVRRMLDLDADSQAIDEALGRDAVLAPLVAASPGIRLPGSLDAEETLFRTMIGQQISVAAARTVIGRVAGELSATPGLFPTATEIAENGAGVVRGPASRVAAILGAARALAGGELSIDVGMPASELTRALVALPGVGPWTAGYLALRVLGNPDTLLTTDLVMLQSAKKLGLPSTARGLATHGEQWAPWRSYAGMHLWRVGAPALVPAP